jgi:hypothetical protein
LPKEKPKERKRLSNKVKTAVLTEAGYRCAVPTCRGILAIDLHHIWEVNAGGGDDPSNLIALCPTCHALYHRGTIKEESIYAYKAMLVSLSNAFDLEAIDKLLFLEMCPEDYLIVSGDGVLNFSRLIAAGLASVKLMVNNANQLVTYSINLSDKGRHLITAWKSGNRNIISEFLGVEAGATTEGKNNG